MLYSIHQARRDGVGVGFYDLYIADRTVGVHKELDNNLTFSLRTNLLNVSLDLTVKNTGGSRAVTRRQDIADRDFVYRLGKQDTLKHTARNYETSEPHGESC